MNILGVIPSRYASTRFPGKPLADIDGKTMVRRVYEQAEKSTRLTEIVVATDHKEIYDHVTSFGGKACMTSADHPSGTDRCYEALTQQATKYDYVINIQGDEPFISPAQIDLLASLLDGQTKLATLVKLIDDPEQLFSANIVKVILNKTNEAIYFSRATLPYFRSQPQEAWITSHSYYKHIGMYAYRGDTLRDITQLPISALEKAESLEQLRWIENGLAIKVAKTDVETIGIDAPEDIAKALSFISSR